MKPLDFCAERERMTIPKATFHWTSADACGSAFVGVSVEVAFRG